MTPIKDNTRVLFDGGVFANNRQRGIQRYLLELIKRFPLPCNVLMDLPQVCDEMPDRQIIWRNEFFPKKRYELAGRLAAKLKKNFWNTPLEGYGCYFTAYFGKNPLADKIPSIAVLHDMVLEEFPYYFAGNLEAGVRAKKECLNSASKIIAISEATKKSLGRVYPEYLAKTETIYHGAEHLRNVPSHPIAGEQSRQPYVLFVGDRAGYKNFHMVLEAMATTSWPDEIGLRVVGKEFSHVERLMLRSRGLASRVMHCGKVSDSELAHLYSAAHLFIFPSLVEGFGFPLLEAQSLGVPVAASASDVFYEVGGIDAFEAFDPLDASSISRAVASAFQSPRAEVLRARGLANVKRFSWDTCARETVNLIQKESA
jgi:glycosyltransferase involved in cell wall biosynthesis